MSISELAKAMVSPTRKEVTLGSVTRANIANEMVQDWPEKDYLLAYEHIDENIEFDKIAEMLQYYEGALFNWREVRKQIALTLPRKQRKAYRQTTKEMHTRLYNDLLKLQRINY